MPFIFVAFYHNSQAIILHPLTKQLKSEIIKKPLFFRAGLDILVFFCIVIPWIKKSVPEIQGPVY